MCSNLTTELLVSNVYTSSCILPNTQHSVWNIQCENMRTEGEIALKIVPKH